MKAMESLVMLVSWEVWKERNARVFKSDASTLNMVVSKIKEEVALWSVAGATSLGIIMPRE
jgi:hypothetical protein